MRFAVHQAELVVRLTGTGSGARGPVRLATLISPAAWRLRRYRSARFRPLLGSSSSTSTVGRLPALVGGSSVAATGCCCGDSRGGAAARSLYPTVSRWDRDNRRRGASGAGPTAHISRYPPP